MYFALTEVGLKIPDHYYILNWFQIRESHIKLKGLELASGSGKLLARWNYWKNIANDAAQEICNDSSKDVVKGMGMGMNKTTKAILRASKSGAGVHEIKWSLDKATSTTGFPKRTVHEVLLKMS